MLGSLPIATEKYDYRAVATNGDRPTILNTHTKLNFCVRSYFNSNTIYTPKAQAGMLTIPLLLDDVKFFTNLHKGSDSLIKLLTVVSCTELNTNACLTFRYNRIIETGYIDTFLLHLSCKIL